MGKASQGALAWDMDNDALHYVSASVVECNTINNINFVFLSFATVMKQSHLYLKVCM